MSLRAFHKAPTQGKKACLPSELRKETKHARLEPINLPQNLTSTLIGLEFSVVYALTSQSLDQVADQMEVAIPPRRANQMGQLKSLTWA